MFSVRNTCVLLVGALLQGGCGDNLAGGAAPPDAGTGTGSGSGDGGVPGVDEHGCRILTLGKPTVNLNLASQVTGVRYRVSPNIGDARPDYLMVELFDSTTPGLGPLTTGTFDVSAPPNTDFGTCQHCVWINTDTYRDNDTFEPYGIPHDLYYATTGSVTLDVVTDPLDVGFVGSTSHVELHHAVLTADGHSTIQPGGDCVSIGGATFDTAAKPGAACESAEDCGNPQLLVCDPTTHTCGDPPCNFDLPCADASQICVTQFPNQFNGVCYTQCDPSAASTACGTGQTCEQLGVSPFSGYCRDEGPAVLGGACTVEDNTTSCAGDAVCSDFSETCTNSCSFYSAVTGCASGTVCSLFGVCEVPAAGVAVGIGEACPAGATVATGCASDGQAFRGYCFGFEPLDPTEPRTCEQACLGPEHCAADQFCAPRFTSGLGICQPLPVCGDGQLGEINEICDDGNTVNGDGCSSTCRAEYDVLCAAAPELVFGTPVAGDTSNGVDGFLSTCQAGIARGQVFHLTPPGPGQLTVHVDSATFQSVAVRSDCADATTERACEVSFGTGANEVVQLKSVDPMTVVVTAFTAAHEGAFTLTADFIPETCGDGLIVGSEVCDDGNATAGDGCSADCHAFEYDVLCAQAPVLSTTAATTGDTTTSLDRFVATCTSSEEGNGRDDLYTFVAPDAGTLHLSLDDNFSLLGIAVFDGCGAPGNQTELACVIDDPEETDVALVAGQQISVVVDGFAPFWFGPYTLTATFTPAPN